MYENGLIRKLILISNFMKLSTGKQMITIHILSNISRSVREYKITFIFLEKSYTKGGGETSNRAFSK